VLHRTVLSAFTLCACASLAPAQTLVRSVNGPAADAQFGKACLVVPDQNSDGVKDVLVGAPGFNSGRGAVYCVSGAYLLNGLGSPFLWTIAPATNAGDQFGSVIAEVGDATGDGPIDFLVGEPGYDRSGVVDRGAVRLIHGATHALGPELYGAGGNDRFGSGIALACDVSGDGRREVVVGAAGSIGALYLLYAETLAVGGPLNTLNVHKTVLWPNEAGGALTGSFDYNGDGFEEIVAGLPGRDNNGAVDAGGVIIQSFAPGGTSFSFYPSFSAGERLGQSVSMGQDYDGDGAPDIVVGAPNASNGSAYQTGRVVVLSGARLFAQTPPYEIHTFDYGSVTPPASHSDPSPNFHFGAAVRACADLNGDGVGEILIGAPDYFTQSLFPAGWNFRGLVRVFSGATGVRLSNIPGASTDRLGEGVGDTLDDLDGDGFKEFVVAGALSDAGGTDSGVIKCYRLFPLAPSVYCTGKINSLGCQPAIGFSGVPSASSSAPFTVTATGIINQKIGLLFYSGQPVSVLFQGGFKCVANPSLRTPAQTSGGATSGSSCTGAYSLDFNAWMASGADPSLGAGAEVFAQFWSRDPASPSHTSLSNALRFVINP
jgi:hypothetical protein